MYITREVYRDLVRRGVARIGKIQDLYLEHRGTFRPSLIQAMTDYRLEMHIAFGNVFAICKEGSLVYGYR